ncbi:unnamed protein product, partial [marine sediment metagenome]
MKHILKKPRKLEEVRYSKLSSLAPFRKVDRAERLHRLAAQIEKEEASEDEREELS